MHELSVALGIVNAALKRVKRGRVVEVQVAVGELTHINAEQLRFAFEIASRGTALEGAKLKTRILEAELRCVRCRTRGREFTCSRCGSAMEVLSGDELMLEKLKVVEDAPRE
jgi:hydrogenase nickel incorporation protein HypA/HybF